MADSAAFISAVGALYGYDAQQQQAANQWLNDFSKQPAAWQVGIDILSATSPTEPMFFCANMLLNKVRTEWGQLSEDQRQNLTNTLG